MFTFTFTFNNLAGKQASGYFCLLRHSLRISELYESTWSLCSVEMIKKTRQDQI